MSFLIPLSKTGGPLFRQVYQGLRQAILVGTFRAGEGLPSTRTLAEELGVSRTVVLLAYEQLLAEGFVVGRAGSGTYVAEGIMGGAAAKRTEIAKARVSSFGASAMEAAAGLHFPERRATTLPFDFTYESSDVATFPFEAWRRTLLRHARRAPVREFDYGPPAGSTALREAITSHLRRARAVVCDPSQVLIVNGSQQALDLVARVLIERGDRVVIEEPHYQGAREIFRAAGARLLPIAVDHDGLDPELLPREARIAVVTPSHQFPTGAILSLPRRVALLEWAKRRNTIVVEDDYDGEFRYDGQPVESLQGLDSEGRVVYIGTFSRTIFPALRIGYLVAPKSLIEPLLAAKWLCDRHTATLEQETLAEFIASGSYERHLRRVRRRNAARRGTLLDAFGNYLSDRAELTGDGAGSHVVLWPLRRTSEERAVARAAAVGVGVYGIARYFLGTPTRCGLLLGYSRVSESQIREGMRRLQEILR